MPHTSTRGLYQVRLFFKLEPSIQGEVELGGGIFGESPSRYDICANDVEGESMVPSVEVIPAGSH